MKQIVVFVFKLLSMVVLLGLTAQNVLAACPRTTDASIDKMGQMALGANYKGLSFDYLCKYTAPASNLPLYHAGIDLIARYVDTYSIVNGTVKFIRGGMVIIETTYNGSLVYPIYYHLNPNQVYVKEGQPIFVGTRIAQTGEWNTVGAPHLHIEVRKSYTGDAVGRSSCGTACDTSAKVANITINPVSLISASPSVNLINPASGATNVPPTNLAFNWDSKNATAHRIVVSTNSSFSGFVDAGGDSYCSNTSTCKTATTTSATSTTLTLSPAVTYYWKVRASGAGGDVWSSYRSFTTSSANSKPNAPTSLNATPAGTTITLRWTDASNNESGFRVYRWNGSAWAALTSLGAGSTSYANSGLSSGTTFYYYVCSYNSAGESCSSAYVSATTASASSTPGSVSVNPTSGSWTSNQNLAVSSSGATRIYYKMVNTYNGTTPADPASPSSSSYDGYLTGPSANFSLSGNSGQIKQTKLRFVGCNSQCGQVSGVYAYSIDLRPTKPAVPANQSASAASSSSIAVRWADSSNNESGFRVYRWSGSSWVSVATPGAGSTSYTNSGLAASTTYHYYICSYNSAGESCPSNYVQAQTSAASGSSWDGKSPSGTVCEQDSTTVASRSNSYGRVELRWSNTCKTNWTRVVPNSSSYSTYGKVRRTSDGRYYTTSGTGTRFTSMVYAPTVQSCASGTIKGYSISEVCR